MTSEDPATTLGFSILCEQDLFLQIPWNMNHNISCRKETFLKVLYLSHGLKAALATFVKSNGIMGARWRDCQHLSHEIIAIILKMLLSCCGNCHQRGLCFLKAAASLQTWLTPKSRSIRQRGKFTCCSPSSLITEDREFDGRLVSGIKEEVICSTANSFLINFSKWGSSIHYLFKLLRLIS